jgi:hypothetical protein
MTDRAISMRRAETGTIEKAQRTRGGSTNEEFEVKGNDVDLHFRESGTG